MSAAGPAAKERVRALCEADRAAWLTREPFLARLVLQLDIVAVIDDRLPTAATDGCSIFVSVPFILGLSAQDRRFVLAHEAWHCALAHLPRRNGRDPARWNVAADHEVNALLREQGLALPEDAIWFHQWDGLAAEEVYRRLPLGSWDRGARADVHELAGLGNGLDSDPDLCPVEHGFASWPPRLRAVVETAGRTGGRIPGSLMRRMAETGRPALPWQDILARFVGCLRAPARGWSRPSRRALAAGLILPGPTRERPSLAVAIDASGSCWEDLPRFLAELRGAVAAAQGASLRLLLFDAVVQGDETVGLDLLADPQRLKIRGGGGTDFRPVFDRLANSGGTIDGLVVLTDGFGDAPAMPPPYPVLWVLTPEGASPAPWAHCLRLPDFEPETPPSSSCTGNLP
jgi:predicted metal-dependent peptidase